MEFFSVVWLSSRALCYIKSLLLAIFALNQACICAHLSMEQCRPESKYTIGRTCVQHLCATTALLAQLWPKNDNFFHITCVLIASQCKTNAKWNLRIVWRSFHNYLFKLNVYLAWHFNQCLIFYPFLRWIILKGFFHICMTC